MTTSFDESIPDVFCNEGCGRIVGRARADADYDGARGTCNRCLEKIVAADRRRRERGARHAEKGPRCGCAVM